MVQSAIVFRSKSAAATAWARRASAAWISSGRARRRILAKASSAAFRWAFATVSRASASSFCLGVTLPVAASSRIRRASSAATRKLASACVRPSSACRMSSRRAPFLSRTSWALARSTPASACRSWISSVAWSMTARMSPGLTREPSSTGRASTWPPTLAATLTSTASIVPEAVMAPPPFPEQAARPAAARAQVSRRIVVRNFMSRPPFGVRTRPASGPRSPGGRSRSGCPGRRP